MVSNQLNIIIIFFLLLIKHILLLVGLDLCIIYRRADMQIVISSCVRILLLRVFFFVSSCLCPVIVMHRVCLHASDLVSWKGILSAICPYGSLQSLVVCKYLLPCVSVDFWRQGGILLKKQFTCGRKCCNGEETLVQILSFK